MVIEAFDLLDNLHAPRGGVASGGCIVAEATAQAERYTGNRRPYRDRSGAALFVGRMIFGPPSGGVSPIRGQLSESSANAASRSQLVWPLAICGNQRAVIGWRLASAQREAGRVLGLRRPG